MATCEDKKRSAWLTRLESVVAANGGPVDRHRRLRMQKQRPKRRSDCINGPRPCPWASCRYHLAITVHPSGRLVEHSKRDDFSDLAETCGLDAIQRAAVESGMLDVEIAEVMGMTSERVDQIATKALAKPELLTLARANPLASSLDQLTDTRVGKRSRMSMVDPGATVAIALPVQQSTVPHGEPT